MNRINITTNRGKLFDWWINTQINFWLWFRHIDNDVDTATEISAKVLRKYQ